jgi:type IV pilus assembly protein PilC
VRHLSGGNTFTDTLASTRLFPKAMLRLSAAGEKTGRLPDMLERAADYYEAQVDSSFKTLTSLVEPMIILVLGLFIAVLLVSMYLPLFELIGSL